MARTKRAARIATGMRAPRTFAPYTRCGTAKIKTFGRTHEPVDSQLVSYNAGPLRRLNPRDFVQATHAVTSERFWVQIVKYKDGVVWGIVDNELSSVDWSQGKRVSFSTCCICDIFAGEA